MSSNDADILIIGFGNTLRADDGAGRLAAVALADSLNTPGLRVLDCQQLMPELAQDIAQASAVLFIDASAVDPPGQIVCRPVAQVSPSATGPHDLTPASLLAWSGRIFGRTPPAWVWSIGAADFELSDQLSPAVADGLPRLEQAVATHARRLLADKENAGMMGEPLSSA
jgi:hydrogenase maturation protease